MNSSAEEAFRFGQYPLAYLITLTCYGTRLHGDGRFSVDRSHNQFNTPFLRPDPPRYKAEHKRLRFRPYHLDCERRRIVGNAFRLLCQERGWDLISYHLRNDHIHLVVGASVERERLLSDLKGEASHQLNLANLDRQLGTRWTRGGSTVYLWTPESVAEAVDYVLNQQGPPMEIYLADVKLV